MYVYVVLTERTLSKGRKSLLEDLPSLNESEASSGPLLSAVVRRMTSKLPNPPTQNLNDEYATYLTTLNEDVAKTDSLSGVRNGDGVSVHGKTLILGIEEINIVQRQRCLAMTWYDEF